MQLKRTSCFVSIFLCFLDFLFSTFVHCPALSESWPSLSSESFCRLLAWASSAAGEDAWLRFISRFISLDNVTDG